MKKRAVRRKDGSKNVETTLTESVMACELAVPAARFGEKPPRHDP